MVDNFLRKEVLEQLKMFCEEGTVFHGAKGVSGEAVGTRLGLQYWCIRWIPWCLHEAWLRISTSNGNCS